MTDFTKTKTHFALALLATLFAVHPFLDRFQDVGFVYLGYELKMFYAYALIAGCLALAVYCYGLALISERPHSWLEKLGNYSYALAVMVLPLYGGLYLSSLLADQLGQSHWAWAAPAAALSLGIGWLVLSQLLAWLLRGRLGRQDRSAQIEQLAQQEVTALNHARQLFAEDHYDLSVIETWKAIEARLHRVLIDRGITPRQYTHEALIRAVKRTGLLREPALRLLQEAEHQWKIAISTEPLSKDAAQAVLDAARQVLATIPLHDLAAEITPLA
jgi:HEPN domain-containing protein